MERDRRVDSGANQNPSETAARKHQPRHGALNPQGGHMAKALVLALVAALTFLATVGAAGWIDLELSIGRRGVPPIGPHDPPLIDMRAGREINLLVLGQDTRAGEGNAALGGYQEGEDMAGHMSDTAMVVQISADRSYINLVSIQRDSLVDAPACPTSRGLVPAQRQVMFNTIFSSGWQKGGDLASAASCSLTAVGSLTGLDLHDFIVVDFQGLKGMIDAVGGVDLCIAADTKDDYIGLDLARGLRHLNGTQATQYARMRHGSGTDGTDIMRTTRQQYLVKQLMNQTLAKRDFSHSSQLYELSFALLNALNFSPGLGSARPLVGLAASLKDFKTSHLYSQTLPVIPAPSDKNRRIWAPAAEGVWQTLRDHKPLVVQETKQIPEAGEDTSGEGSGVAGSQPQDHDQAPSPAVDPTTGLYRDEQGTPDRPRHRWPGGPGGRLHPRPPDPGVHRHSRPLPQSHYLLHASQEVVRPVLPLVNWYPFRATR
ncbi:LCP family protein [Bifidobacterium aemilianum]|uniref:LCP family protein n=1 Tax=Bifidobacterium aemilianum TaxID=2493120 RepID=UPI001F2E66FB|nr:LCP family protein [Bifidobacterium aemilianum]